MEERFIEIQFCIFISRLLTTFRYALYTLDIIEAYCNLGGVDPNIIKKYVRQIKANECIIVTSGLELTYFARLNNISYRELQKLSGVSLSTQLKYKKELEANPNIYDNVTRHTDLEDFYEIKKFMRIVEIMRSI